VTDVLVDSNILIDVLTEDAIWGRWSTENLSRLSLSSTLVINPLIFAEASGGVDSIEALEDILPESLYRRDQLPYTAAFLAGKAFVEYRRRGGLQRSPLPDFYIGAHAAVAGFHLLTRDPSRYRTYFPTITLIAP
jgi:predicted nucleic acid-binding protein